MRRDPRFRTARAIAAALAVLALPSLLGPASLVATADDATEFFEKQVRPLLAASCYSCHSAQAKEIKGGLRLDSRARVLAGGDSGPAIVPGQPKQSRLVEAVGYQDPDLQMPPKARLPPDKVAVLTRWVEMGAPWPETSSGVDGQLPQPTTPPSKFDLAKRRATHWVWQPIHVVAPAAVKHIDWARDPLDNYLLARWEAAGLQPPRAAERRTLLRRVYFDLVGLPPTAEEVEAFVADRSPRAFETVVDRLLASPRFGERWARHWLDLVRYGETRGHEFDYEIPNAWQYRDYVIRALNADVPYNQFVAEQIAGDLLPAPRTDPTGRINESILGTGFWFLGEWVHSPVDIRGDETDRVDNQIDVLGKTFLGLTLGCARCHDHKFDAISSRDYYALAGMLESSSFRDVQFEWQAHNRQVVERVKELDAATRKEILRRVIDDVRPTLGQFAAYLLAACDALRDAESPNAESKIAARDHLDAAQIRRLVALIRQANKDPFDPLYPWAVLALDSKAADLKRTTTLWQSIATDWQTEATHSAELPPGAALIVDYGHPHSEQWLTDGLAFGDESIRPGRIVLAGEGLGLEPPSGSVAEVVPQGCADSGLLGRSIQGMLRTPEFTISAPQVWYRIRGSANVFVVVDSHRMVAGPLHAGTKRHVDAGPKWTWTAHDVHDYVGQRAHVEFTPADPQGYIAISAVVQSPSAPAEAGRANPLLSAAIFAAISSDKPSPAEKLAQRYQELLIGIADDLAADRLADQPDAAARAQFGNWVLQHAADFSTASQESAEKASRQLADYRRQREAILSEVKSSATAMAMLDGNGLDEHVLLRGSYKTPGQLAPRRLLEAIAGSNQPPIQHGSGRLELANRLLDPSDPLPPRVLVNRVWQHLFGRGIVSTVDNFGVLGQRPTHPELLDFLADRFVHDGWSVKRLIRGIVLSSAYQMSAEESPRDQQNDPDDLLWHHALVRRLEGEAIRDAILTDSGRLNLEMGGPSEEVFLTPFMLGRGRPGRSGPLDGDGRRSVYLKVRRNFLSPMMTAFDMPAPFNTVGNRGTSNQPAQALILLNDPFVIRQSRVWAHRVLAEKAATPRERIHGLYLAAFARPPSDDELADDLAFLEQQGQALGLKSDAWVSNEQVWADLCHVLLNVKEFIFID